jgi:hypothetical protein
MCQNDNCFENQGPRPQEAVWKAEDRKVDGSTTSAAAFRCVHTRALLVLHCSFSSFVDSLISISSIFAHRNANLSEVRHMPKCIQFFTRKLVSGRHEMSILKTNLVCT